jgi:hypothetical protein
VGEIKLLRIFFFCGFGDFGRGVVVDVVVELFDILLSVLAFGCAFLRLVEEELPFGDGGLSSFLSL